MGRAAKRIVTRHEGLQEQLGELQDHIMMVAMLRELAGRGTTPPRVGFACGVLAERHARARRRARRRFSAADRGALASGRAPQ